MTLLRCDLVEYLRTMSGLEAKVYMSCLLSAKSSGPDAGTLLISVRDLASDVGARWVDVSRALYRLSEPGMNLLEYQPVPTLYDLSTIRVTRYAVDKNEGGTDETP